MHARGSTNVRPAVEARLAAFEAQVDPNNELSPDERRKRALHARRAHMSKLALASAIKRREARG